MQSSGLSGARYLPAGVDNQACKRLCGTDRSPLPPCGLRRPKDRSRHILRRDGTGPEPRRSSLRTRKSRLRANASEQSGRDSKQGS